MAFDGKIPIHASAIEQIMNSVKLMIGEMLGVLRQNNHAAMCGAINIRRALGME